MEPPEWQRALLAKKRAKAASLSGLLELYSARPGVRILRAERIVIVETRDVTGHVTTERGDAVLRAEEVVVFEPEPGRVRRLRKQYEKKPMDASSRQSNGEEEAPLAALRMRKGRPPTPENSLRTSEGQRCSLRMRGSPPQNPMDASSRQSNGEEGAPGAARRMCTAPTSESSLRMSSLRMRKGRRLVSLQKPMDASSQNGEAPGAALRMHGGQDNMRTSEARRLAPLRIQEEEAPGAALRMRDPQTGAESSGGARRMRSPYMEKIAANTFVVRPRGRRAIDPREGLAEGGAWPGATVPKLRAWPPAHGATVPKGRAWAAAPRTTHPKSCAWPPSHDATVPNASAWPPSPDATVPKPSAWPPSHDATVPNASAWPPAPDATVPNASAWPPSPDATVPNASAWPPSPDATVPNASAWPPSPDATVPNASAWAPSPDATVPKEGAWTASPGAMVPNASAWPPSPGATVPNGSPGATLPNESAWLPDATVPKEGARLPAPDSAPLNQSARSAPMRRATAPGAALSPSPNDNAWPHHSRATTPKAAPALPNPMRGVAAPPGAGARHDSRHIAHEHRVPVTLIDGDATVPLAPLRVLSPRLEGCDVAAWGPGFESHGEAAPGAQGKVARYPSAEEIEVIGGYLALERSCMRKGGARRRKKLKISFDDLHTMFEYPSENSLEGQEAEEEEEEVEEEEEEEEYASEVDQAPPLPAAQRKDAGFPISAQKPQSGEFEAAAPRAGTVAPGADSPDAHAMLTPAGAGARSDFGSEPALYF